MTNSNQTKRTIFRFVDGEESVVEDVVATEIPITVKINGEEVVTMISSPDHIEDMVVGYLVSEGVILSVSELTDLRYEAKRGFVHVTLKQALNPLHHHLQTKRYLTSCCGMSRQSFIFAADAKTTKTMKTRHVVLSPTDCLALMNELQEGAMTFKETGGVHNAALATPSGIVLMRSDIGRHNALDKLYGYCLRHKLSLEDKVIIFSGRLSSEIVLKVAKIGCEVILSKSAPTNRALEIAEELEITTVGFIRHQSMNVYTVPERINRSLG
ncbi:MULTISPECIES: formate dehydrogenase accessory sulfurtransferase FdhD [Bacillaceae]|uniref:Sulfur carrier protein FdhD n=2 Tax=Bacillaceae TaxID=186817 RepID=A0A9D5DNJ2_9BACI|nr:MULTISPECIES: formate dehydrogenase accessory sulfurtransferase FdhD [Bacillaceae]KQL57095.1 formate dehydrogenase family accessory protein FdhD [Alkalicoccobacillus plakortidis]MBG9783616.1 formate dehydrogenase [Shouchella lehensis]RQW21402.1 formate dehydrogenase accessory sulfurtransferase FdhD [Bacillus sp. C1-1]TES51435.1 formate dehydrogenase accessory sulfurtransferase FdhD [Shouchella lehensis]